MKPTLLAAVALLLATGCTASDPEDAPVSFDADVIFFSEPDMTRSTTVGEALRNRRICDGYSDEPITFKELSGLLRAASDRERAAEQKGTTRIYVFVAEGIYAYDAETHSLVRLFDEDRRDAVNISVDAPMYLVYMADQATYPAALPAALVQETCRMVAETDAGLAALYADMTGLHTYLFEDTAEDLCAMLELDENWMFARAQSVRK